MALRRFSTKFMREKWEEIDFSSICLQLSQSSMPGARLNGAIRASQDKRGKEGTSETSKKGNPGHGRIQR
jgi:hypothetical protein